MGQFIVMWTIAVVMVGTVGIWKVAEMLLAVLIRVFEKLTERLMDWIG